MTKGTKIEIPCRLEFGPTDGRWIITNCLEKLKEKYGENCGRSRSLEFDQYGWDRARSSPRWTNRLEGADLAATTLMNSRISGKDMDRLLSVAADVGMALQQIPANLDLFTTENDIPWSALETLFGTLEMHNIGTAKITKAVCMKRPRLIPMLDAYVMEFIFKGGWPDLPDDTYAQAALAGMKQFRALMMHGNNLAAVKLV